MRSAVLDAIDDETGAAAMRMKVDNGANASCRRQKFCCGDPQKGFLGFASDRVQCAAWPYESRLCDRGPAPAR